MEAIFAKSLDVTYVGPGPALNAYLKSNGEEIRVISGAANGGAALLVKADSPIKAPADFRKKKNRHTSTRQHPGHFMPGMAESARIQSHPNWR